MSRAAEVVQMIRQAASTPPAMGCWEWNEEHGRLSSRDSAMPGRWRGDLVPHMRHWQDLISARRLGRRYAEGRGREIAEVRQRVLDKAFWKGGATWDQYAHLVEQLWLVAGTQSTKTRSFLYAALGYSVDQHPAPMGLVLPRLKDFKRVLDNRIKPFFLETPALARHFPQGKRARAQAIGYQAWTMLPMTLFMLCSEVSDDLRQFPMRDTWWDEFDLAPLDCEGEGDPIEIGGDRGKTWPRSMFMGGATTPTKVHKHGWKRLCMGSHERLHIICPRCGAVDTLDPDQLRVPDGATSGEVKIKRLATYECRWCETQIPDDGTKDQLISQAAAAGLWIPGKWEITAQHVHGLWTPAASFDPGHRLIELPPPETTIRSGHMNSLYSPFVTLSQFKAKELDLGKKGNLKQRIAYVNGWRCEPTLETIIAPPNMTEVAETATVYGYTHGTGPALAVENLHLGVICDQQGNSRLEAWFPYSAMLFSPDEMWLIEAGQVKGFEGLAALEKRKWMIGRIQMGVESIACDGNNGRVRVPLQEWAANNPKLRMLLTGRQWPDFNWRLRDPGGKKEKRNKRIVTGARIYSFHANAYKTDFDEMMRSKEGAKRWNLPDDAPQFFIDSMTSEEQVEADVRIPGLGKQRQVVFQPRVVLDESGATTVRTDTHWWDTQSMALVMAEINDWTTPKPPPQSISADAWFKKQKGKS